MSFERPTAGSGFASEPGSPPSDFDETPRPAADGGPATTTTPASMRLQILSTEHWSLLATRSLAWNEAFSRAGMFLATLSGAIVALAIVGPATDFDDGFLLTALVILPVVLFVGIATVVRLGASNYHDAMCVIGMNRIRHAYLELAPDLEPYFVMSSHDDVRGRGHHDGHAAGGQSDAARAGCDTGRHRCRGLGARRGHRRASWPSGSMPSRRSCWSSAWWRSC